MVLYRTRLISNIKVMKHQLDSMIFGKNNIVSVERTSDLAAYYAMIANFQPLTIEEEVELGWLAKAGDEEAKTKLINANLRAVVSIAKQYAYCAGCLTITDLINEGNIGLINAANTYDPSIGTKFMSYAVGHIRQYILAALTNKSRIVSDYHKGASNRHSSLDAPTSDDDSTTLGDILCTSTDSESFANESLANDIMRVLNNLLKPNEMTIICVLYGIGAPAQRRWEIAEKLGKTEERIRQTEQSALNKIRSNQQALLLLAKYRG